MDRQRRMSLVINPKNKFNMLPHLTFDIQVQIIKKLPVKSLIQFRSVCKAWKSLIDSSQFIVGYSDRHDLPQHLVVMYLVKHGEEIEVKYGCFVDDDTFPQQMFSLTVPPLVQATAKVSGSIISSSHGLLFLTDDDPTAVNIWNPTIRKSIVVDLPNPVDDLYDFVVGFGVCPDTKDPTLVKMTYIRELWEWDSMEMDSIRCIPCQAMIFTLSSGEWTCISGSNLPRKSIEFSWLQTVVGQFIYWLVSDWIAGDGTYDTDRCRHLIISFHMSTQEFREIDLPDALATTPCVSDFDVYRLRESPAVLGYDTVSSKLHCDVWIMEHGDSNTFTKLYTINLPNNASLVRTVGFTKSGKPIIEMCDNFTASISLGALVVYQPDSKHIMDLGIRGMRYTTYGCSHTESLILLDQDDGHMYDEVTFGTCD